MKLIRMFSRVRVKLCLVRKSIKGDMKDKYIIYAGLYYIYIITNIFIWTDK